jgi:hypothetical protein
MPLVDWDQQSTWDAFYDYSVGGEPPGTGRVVLGYFGPVVRQFYVDHAARIDAAVGGPPAHNQRMVSIGSGYGYGSFELANVGFQNIVSVEQSAYIQATKADTWTQQLRDWITAAGHDPDTGWGLEVMQKFPTHTEVRAPVTLLDETVSTSQGRTAIRQAVGGNPQIVFTESVMESLSDAEGQALTDDMDAFGGQQAVIHGVYLSDPAYPNAYDPALNWKNSLADWNAAITGVDVWLDLGTGEVLAG